MSERQERFARGNPHAITKADLDDYARRLSNWGRWGDDDEIGTLNFVTPRMVAEAAQLVTEGARFSLGLPFEKDGPQTLSKIRTNPIHLMRMTGTDAVAGALDHMGLRGADDWIIMPLQSATHWDALSHVFFGDRMYNGYPATEVSSFGARKCGIEKAKDRFAGRGVLIDVARALGVDVLEEGFAITNDILDDTLARQGVTVQRGDFLMVRTGNLEHRQQLGSWGNYGGGDSPGLAFETAEWLHAKEVAAVALDTWGCEVRPNNSPGISQPWHWIVIPMMGLTMGENFYLKDLADHCAADGRYEFFFTAAPLNIPGSVSGVINPMAFK
ncbi:cyclase family protein [Pseudooceanicola sp. 216_PA32_1]|uniref:Cyclase family protein n=1 Tax=Pseudooceanicola pacificus TaxID=2676438 RepID=A0A844WD46_9RHOB|nr:cyclase family protein [Pseudooceanicola pacificus]MWB78262.1 cyclase family protein [Pseudooceanicola pacificus]